MYIDDQTYQRNGVTYRRVLLRHGQRVSSKKTKLTTIANLSDCSEQEIEALKIALSNKQKIAYLHNLSKGNSYNGKIYGPVVCLNQISQQLGLNDILRTKDIEAKLNLWMVFSRFFGSSSRLSAVRQAKIHAGCEILGIDSLVEDDLYKALDWLYEHKTEIEKRIYTNWEKKQKSKPNTNHVFLYDLSSSYLEGTKNELAAFGYNRDKKEGKMIITYGLLTDQDGDPLAIEVFPGNTADNKTLKTQINKIKEQYKAQYVTFVGDKGMIKSQEQELISSEDNFYYITSITKAQIETMLSNKFIELSFFDQKLCEIDDVNENIRYILRRNPVRAQEISLSRESKVAYIKKEIKKSNQYLLEHPKAKIEIQTRNLTDKIKTRKLSSALKVEQDIQEERKIKLEIDQQQLTQLSNLDGCYVIKTNLPKELLEKEKVHLRYKDLAFVEQAFREIKSLLNVRSIYVRKKERTIAHLLISMLAYKIERHLREIWIDFDYTPLEAIEVLNQLGSNIIHIGKARQVTISNPLGECKQLLDKANVIMPSILPYKEADVNTKRKLKYRRKKIKIKKIST